MHNFIFTSGTWLGEGNITFSTSPESIKFYMKWESLPEVEGSIKAMQMIQMQGIEEKTVNLFIFSNFVDEKFDLVIENQHFGQVAGHGEIKPDALTWTFKENIALEGTESYNQINTDEYRVKAKYGTAEHFTFIEGKIWLKST